ncbi:hypothetical protein [Pontibacter chinhatensis]|uniref:hypothetical protein n=1 Tax=Pontibacter chinhatensis TaxID=1436961 RepID=UPI00111405D0|nr:hypothetical protein [Pontibacter chinhatensis]
MKKNEWRALDKLPLLRIPRPGLYTLQIRHPLLRLKLLVKTEYKAVIISKPERVEASVNC